jgi:flagellar protein FliO/FliZ
LFRTLTALAIVLVLMGLVALAARRVLGSRLGLVGARPLVQVLASGYIAPRKTVALVSVAGEYLIVGTTATDLVPLGRVSDPTKVQELLASTAADPPSATPSITGSCLTSWLRHLQGRSFANYKGSHGDQ